MTSEIVSKDDERVLKLPLWLTIQQAYGSYLIHFPDVLRATAPWLVIAPLATGGAIWLQMVMLQRMLAAAHQGGMPIAAMLPYFSHIVLDLALVSIAVAWHRRIIIDERPTPLASHFVTGRFWRYVGMCLVLVCISLVVVSVLSIPLFAAATETGPQVRLVPGAFGIASTAIAMSVTIAVTCRLLPLLPAKAIDDRTLTFRMVWQGTRGNTWRLFWGTLACSILPVLPKEIVGYVILGGITPLSLLGPALAPLVIFTAISAAYNVLAAPIFAGFLSFAYRHFFEQPSLAHD